MTILPLEQNIDNVDPMETEATFAEESETEHAKEATTEDIHVLVMRTGDSEDEEDVRDDVGALSTDDEEFIIGKKKPLSRGRPRGKKVHHPVTFPEVQTHVHVPVREVHFIDTVEPSVGNHPKVLVV